jgi:hypothetical protein
MREKAKTLSLKIDARLAAQYRAAYAHAFGDDDTRDEPLAIFIAGFLEDRLREETEFALSETPRKSQ